MRFAVEPKWDGWRATPAAASIEAAGELWDTTRRLQLEGVVAKRVGAPYRPGQRGAAWLQLKRPRARDLQAEPGDQRWKAAMRWAAVLPAANSSPASPRPLRIETRSASSRSKSQPKRSTKEERSSSRFSLMARNSSSTPWISISDRR